MNVIDFHVTKILSEKYGKVYELYGMTLEKAQSHPKSSWREYLLSDGVLQEYEFWDYGGTRTESVSAHLQMLIIPAMLVSTKRLYSLMEKGYL